MPDLIPFLNAVRERLVKAQGWHDLPPEIHQQTIDLAHLLTLVEAGEEVVETAKLFDGECKYHDTIRGGRCDNCGQPWPCQFKMLIYALIRYTVACQEASKAEG